MKKILVILGPTATGKTDIALKIAKKLRGELVACDSRQVYKGLDIGAGKLPGVEVNYERGDGCWILDSVKIWMYDVVQPSTRYDVVQFIADASKAIEKIGSEKKLPIIVGGTGMYLNGLLNGFSNLSIPGNEDLRTKLEESSLGELQKKLMVLSPIVYENLNDSDRKNSRRLIRKIEMLSMYGHIGKKELPTPLSESFDVLKIGLTAPRPFLNERIDQRVLSRIDKGMIEEAENLHKNGLSLERMKELGLEYGILSEYIEEDLSKEELIEKLMNKIHQYAKRQMTWFKRDEEISWFDITKKDFDKKVEKKVSDWY